MDETEQPYDMDERVATAMVTSMFAPHELPVGEDLWHRYMATARAVIVTIANAGFIIAPQDPTAEQIAAASEATPGDVADMYRAMIGQYALEISF